MEHPKISRTTLTASIALAASLGAGDVFAQGQLEEIVVTAQYREENLQEVPVAVTAFTADEIMRAGIEATQDFVNLTPNMTLDDSFTLGNTFVQVRGVAQINNADSPVAIVIDGVPQNNQKQFKQELFDIERIEVLKGPQGSLYGRNAIGGAINIVSKAPTNDFTGFIRGGIGNGDLVKINGAFSGAIVPDKLLFRVSGSHKDFDGIVRNTFLNETVDFYESNDIRARLIFNATENFTAEARFAYSDADGGCCSDTFLFNDLVGNAPNPTGISNPANNTFNNPSMNVLGQTDELESREFTVKLNYGTEMGDFTYIFNDTSIDESYFADLDFTDGVDTSLGWLFTNAFFGGLPVGANQQQFLEVDLQSHELRFASPDDRRLRWIAGFYYLKTDRFLATIGDFDFTPTTPIFSRDQFSGIPFVSLSEDNNNDAWSLFGQLEYDIADDLELAVGLRYDEDKRRHNGAVGGVPATDRTKTFDDLQPKVVLTKRWNEDALTYLSYSRGFRSGGFNGPAIGSAEFQEETLDNFELGFKSTWLDNRLLLNGAIFLGKSDDFQFFFVDLVTASQVIANIEEVDMFGGELEMQALINDNFSIYGTLGITDTDIERSEARPQDEGNRAPKNQKYTFNIGGQYVREVLGGMEARARLDYERRGRKYWHSDNNNSMDPFGLINARVSLSAENYEVTAWVKNLQDRRYWQDYNAAAFSGAFGDIGFLARGRTWGLDIEYRFE